MRKFLTLVLGVFILLAVSNTASAYPISASTDRMVYQVNSSLVLSGEISHTEAVNITAFVFNSSGSLMGNTTKESVNSTKNTFSLNYTLDVAPGEYLLNVTDGTDSIALNFKVLEELLALDIMLLKNSTIVPVNTSTLITTGNEMGGNFTELLTLSKSQTKTLHYGNATLDKVYHFVLVDENFAGTYDTVYVDDDKTFLLYNDTEDNTTYPDIEKVLKKGGKIGSHMISFIEFATGNTIFLARPVNTTAFSGGDIVNFTVFVSNSSGYLKHGMTINAMLLNSAGTPQSSSLMAINIWGYAVSNFTTPSTSGTYKIAMNSTMGMEAFSVETFRMFAKITDLGNTPTYSFAPNPIIRVHLITKTLAGSPVNMASTSATLNYPDGSHAAFSFNNAGTGTYSADISLAGAPMGEYGVKITGTLGGDTQEVITGFAVESVKFDIEAINHEFMDQAEGPEAFVNAFAPNSNVTLMAILSNISAGGMMAKGPDGMGLVPIENCSGQVSVTNVKDDRGMTYTANYSVMNITEAMNLLDPDAMEPPADILSQCMIIIWDNNTWLNNTGVYKIESEINYNGEIKKAGTVLGIQKLYASSATVDFNGENFRFFAPNATVNIKLRVTDLSTRQELPGTSIVSAKITSMFQEFPHHIDMFKNITNESVANGTISFLAPDSEGFFSMGFRFKANLSGTIEEGVGNAFFMLKKYMIWGKASCNREPCYVPGGENITLQVTVVDIDQGSRLDMGQSSGLSCTGCEGLVANVTGLWNEQLMKPMAYSSDYTTISGMLTNGSNPVISLKIVPSSLPTGWYGADLLLHDPSDPSTTYMGWAWFEIRNFWVDAMKLVNESGNLTATRGEGGPSTCEAGEPVLFGIVPRDPANPDIILEPTSTPTVKSVKWTPMGPPTDTPYSAAVSQKLVHFEWGPPTTIYVVNVTGLTKEGYHQANVEVTTSKGTDIGSFWFDHASYDVNTHYRGMQDWPAVFSSDENLSVTFTGLTFDDPPTPHNLTASGTKLFMVFNEKAGHPVRLNYSTSCPEDNKCIVEVNLSSLNPGWYHAEFQINDSTGKVKETEVEFVIKNFLLSIPAINDMHVGWTDTPTRELSAGNDRDRCDNTRWVENGGSSSWWSHTDNNGSSNYCIQSTGNWQDDNCSPEDTSGVTVNIFSNSTHLWVDGSGPKSAGDVIYGLADKNWTVVGVGSQVSGSDSFRVNASEYICGEDCTQNGCDGYFVVQPSNHSTFYHGFISNLIQEASCNQDFLMKWPGFDENRSVYIYHNTTHVWMDNKTNLTDVTPKTTGEVITGPYGGEWKVSSINKERVTLLGQNVLAKTGAWMNTSLSKSGVIKLENFNEQWLGGWDKEGGQSKGLDLNNDGQTNSTIYIAITDSTTAGVYDTFFFSTDNNMSNPIKITDSMADRTFGLNATLTLLSIDPRANRVIVYGNKTGDWGELGDVKLGNNVTIPVIVRTPAGGDVTASVSVSALKNGNTGLIETISTPPTKEITGKGEIQINLSDLGYGAGSYSFEIKAIKESLEERVDQWRWPRSNMRSYLVDTKVGMGVFVSGFKPLNLTSHDWESLGEIVHLKADRRNITNIVDGVLTRGDPYDYGANGCVPPAFCDGWNNCTILEYEEHDSFFLYSMGDQKLYRNFTSCNFTGGESSYSVGDTLLVNRSGKTYNTTLLKVDIYNSSGCGSGCWRSLFGIPGVDSSIMVPMRNNTDFAYGGQEWGFIQNLTLSDGNAYDILMAGNAVMDYPMCSVWNNQECVKMAWFTTTRNFSQSTGTLIGQNFTPELYLASIGPGPWEGLTIGNFSEVSQMPGISVRTRDSTSSYFNTLIESSLGFDLNMDGELNATFYMLTFDNKEDGVQNLTENIVDDDMNITEQWWSSQDGSSNKDFYNDETGMKEYTRSLPSVIWSGNAAFGDENGMPYEQAPVWDIMNYNRTDMILQKWRDNINKTDNITFTLKVYDFDQNPISGAIVGVDRVMGATPFGFQSLSEGSDYLSENVVNVTDTSGYAMVRLLPNSSWYPGEYTVQINVNSTGSLETINRWFMVMP